MPSRRRPADPSPRLRALLDRGGPERPAPAGVPTLEAAGDPSPHPGGRWAGRDSRVDVVDRLLAGEAWQPDRAWLASPAERDRRGREGGLGLARDGASASGAARFLATAGAGVPVAAPAGSVRTGPGRHRRPSPPGPRWLTLPASLRGARVSGPKAATAGLLLVVLVAALVFGVRLALARAASEPRPVAPGSQTGTITRGAGSFASSTTSAGGGGPPAPGATVTVHVVGMVAHPGVIRLPTGSRVADAVARAGGSTKGADVAALNLARVLVDGEQIRVPKPGEVVAPSGTGAAVPGQACGVASPGSASGGLLNLNTATAAQLEELPGVGPVLAQRILDWRTEHGRFTTVDELGEVSGIGEKIFAQLQSKVTV